MSKQMILALLDLKYPEKLYSENLLFMNVLLIFNFDAALNVALCILCGMAGSHVPS